MVIITIMLNREKITNQNWVYIPEKRIPFGRIHEPMNWSSDMAPKGKTHLVMEHFCFRGDKTWRTEDHELADNAVRSLEKLGLIKGKEVINWAVLRVPKAYPVFDVGYSEHLEKICDYLDTFNYLYLSGRGGMFRYFNMDHAIASGMGAAEKIMQMGGATFARYRS
jgi:protoporphyrinogen oxidase